MMPKTIAPERMSRCPERTTVTTLATPAAAEELVRRLLSTESAGRRRSLIDRHRLTPDELKDATNRLLNEAVKLFGADPPRMERLCADAALLADQTGDEFLQAMVRMRQGDAARAQGRNAEACTLYDEAAATFTRLNRPVEAARTRIGWIDATAKLGRLDDALRVARAARRIFKECGETALVAGVEVSAAMAQDEHGQHPSALRRYTTALDIYRAQGEAGRLNSARTHQGRGSALNQLGRHREALTELELARGTYELMRESAGAARVTRNIGLTQMSLGRYSDALRAFDAARPMFRALGLNGVVVMLAYDTADCHLRLNRPIDALTALDNATAEMSRIDNAVDVLAIATRRVAAHLMLEQNEEALAVLDEAERQLSTGAAQHRVWLHEQRATIYLKQGLAIEALAAAREAEQLARAGGMRRALADAIVIEGSALLAIDEVEKAVQAGRRAARLARSIDAAPLRHRSFTLLGQVAEAQGRTRSAQRAYEAAIKELEREEQGVIFEFRESFAVSRGIAYERLAALQLRAGRAVDALATAERAKSRALSDAILGRVELRPRGTAVARRIARRLARAREDYASEFTRMAAEECPLARERLAQLETEISQLVQQLQLAGDGAETADIYGASSSPATSVLPQNTALIEFFFCGPDILRFRVDSTGVQGAVLRNAIPEAERLLRVFRLNLDATERAERPQRHRLASQARALLNRLYARLFGDLVGLDEYQSLVIVPHGILHYLPFHALHDGERYLVERLSISYAPSAALYEVCRSRRPRRGGVLVLGHSARGRLPFTLAEANRVAAAIGVSARQEAAATRSVLETEGCQAALIHVAAHGEFRPDAPLFSCIELADGPLTTADIFDLDLRAGLVALSACETGRSVLGGGDELVGMTRAFLYAGAAGLLVSQWRVDDASTAELMTHFYQELMHGAGRASALRTAQLECISGNGAGGDRSHPFYWAGFQIIGDDQPLQPRLARAPKEERTP